MNKEINNLEYLNNKTQDKIEKLKDRIEKNENFSLILAISLVITLCFTISCMISIKDIYDILKPKECECNYNNELIIDTDTLTL